VDFSIFLEAPTWLALLTLTFLEIVLGIDNIVFISIVSNKLEKQDQNRVRTIGLFFAMIFRIIMLFSISWLLSMQKPFFSFSLSWLSGNLNGQSIIIFLGGLFLLYKSVTEIHHKLESKEEHNSNNASPSIISAIIQIALLNLVFSFDSILTAIGLVSLDPSPKGFGYEGGMAIMIVSVVISILIMMAFAKPVSEFVNKNPTIEILGLSFLILIGVILLAEASHIGQFSLFGSEVHSIPKGYLYFAIFFSLSVEFINMKLRKSKKSIKLNNSSINENLN
jgi:predicted tellurium resistance membrane protein TerC